MTTDATRAIAQTLPVTRRKALAVTGASLLAGVAAPRPAEAPNEGDTSVAALAALLARHAEAYETDLQLWDAVGDISDAMPEPAECRVEIG